MVVKTVEGEFKFYAKYNELKNRKIEVQWDKEVKVQVSQLLKEQRTNL